MTARARIRRRVGVVLAGGLLVVAGTACSAPQDTGADELGLDPAVPLPTPTPTPSPSRHRTPQPSAEPPPAPAASAVAASGSTSWTGPGPMPQPAPGTPQEWRSGVLDVQDTDVDEHGLCLVLDTGAGRLQLLSAEGLWVPSTSVRADGRVVVRDTGIQRGTGREVYGPIVFGYRQRVRVLGQVLVAPVQDFTAECDGVDGIFSVIDVQGD